MKIRQLVLAFLLVLSCASSIIAQSCVGPSGTIEWLIFRKNEESSQLNYLDHQAHFPYRPDRVKLMSSTATTTNFDNAFGGMLRGYIIPTISGNYQFNITGDDDSKLFLSTDSTKSNLVNIAGFSGWTSETQFTKFPTQTSAIIQLTAGKPYYFEAIYKDGVGGDFLRVHWKTPATTVNETWVIIPAANIARQTCIPTCPEAGTACNDGNPLTTNDQYDSACNCFGTPTNASSCVGERGAVNALIYTSIPGQQISSLLANPNYPLQPAISEKLKKLYKLDTDLSQFGTRIRGFLQVPVSGNYSFNVTGDDRVRLLIGSDPSGSNAVIVAQNSTNSKLFEHYKESAQTSALINLSADSLYYFEFLHKEQFGDNQFGLFWRTPYAQDTVWRFLDPGCVYEYGCELACIPENTPCDDDDPLTYGDKYNEDCTCVGTPCATPACTEALSYTPVEPCGKTDKHSNQANQAWTSCQPLQSPNPTRGISHWIKYDLGQVYGLSGSQVWNYNAAGATSQGFATVAVDYSLDGIEWYTLGNFDWEQATGANGYDGFQFEALNGVVARYLLLTALGNFGQSPCVGISEVAFNAVACDEAGFSCNDGDSTTIGDSYGYNCICRGFPTTPNSCSILERNTGSGMLTDMQYDAINTVLSNGKVALGDKVRFVAGQNIKLTAGFRVEEGAQFAANIMSCNAQPNALLSSQNDSVNQNEIRSRARLGQDPKLSISPNPTRNWAKIHYYVPKQGKIELSVFSIEGQLVVNLQNGEVQAGDGYKSFPAHQLPSGMYFVILRYEGEILSERLLIFD